MAAINEDYLSRQISFQAIKHYISENADKMINTQNKLKAGESEERNGKSRSR